MLLHGVTPSPSCCAGSGWDLTTAAAGGKGVPCPLAPHTAGSSPGQLQPLRGLLPRQRHSAVELCFSPAPQFSRDCADTPVPSRTWQLDLHVPLDQVAWVSLPTIKCSHAKSSQKTFVNITDAFTTGVNLQPSSSLPGSCL